MLHYPIPHRLMKGALQKSIFNRVVLENNVLVLPVNIGPDQLGHWNLFLFDYRSQPLRIWKFDPMRQVFFGP